jgi:molybdate transport system permease protein
VYDRAFRGTLAALFFFLLLLIGAVLYSDVAYIAGSLQSPTAEHPRPIAEFIAGITSPRVLNSVLLSVVTAATTTVLALLIGIPAAYALSRFRLPGAALWDTILDLPIVLPPAVMGISLLVFFQTDLGAWTLGLLDHTPLRVIADWSLGAWLKARPTAEWWHDLTGESDWGFAYTIRGIVLAQFMVAASFCVRSLKAAFDGIDPRIEGVARTLGCSHFRAFTKVAIPAARNGLVAGGVMTWARAIGEFGPILFFVGTAAKVRVMPIAIYLYMSVGDIELALAIAVLMMAIATVTLLTFKRLGGRGYLW